MQIIKSSNSGGGGGGASTSKVKVSAVDTTEDYLSAKLVAGTNITLTASGAGNETLTIAASGGVLSDEKVKYDTSDPTAGYVADKVIAGTGISVAEGTGGNENKLVITNSITQYTDEMAQDAVGNAIGNGLDYDDTTGAISVDESELSLPFLKLDQTTPQTFTGLTDGSLSIKGSELATTQYAHTYFVSKLGADTNNGTSEGTSFLTIGKALENCVSGDLVKVLDGEAYEETLIIPTNVTVDMRNAGLSGEVILATNAKIFVLKHSTSANAQIMVRCIGTSGSLYLCFAGQSSANHTGIIHFKPSAVGGFIVATIAKITVGDGNTLVYSSAGSSGINIATTPASFSSDKALNYGTPADLVYGDSGYCQWDIDAVSFPVAITYNIGTGTTVTMYKIVGTTSTTRGPKNWILEGKLGAAAWETIDTQTDITWTSSEQKEFTIGTPASYDQYRITVASSSNVDWLQIADIGLWAGVASVGGDIMISADILSLGEDSFGILSHDSAQRVITNINNVYQEEDTEDATFITISDGIVSHRGNIVSTDILWNKTGGTLVWDTAFKAGTETGTTTAYTLTQANIEDSVTDGHTTVAPSGNAVFDALAGKASTTHAAQHAVGAADAVFPADPNADKYLKWNNTSNAIEWAYVAGGGDMVLADAQSVTGAKTFDKDTIKTKGTSTGVTTISTANTSATDYVATLPAKTGTIAMTSDITGGAADQSIAYMAM